MDPLRLNDWTRFLSPTWPVSCLRAAAHHRSEQPTLFVERYALLLYAHYRTPHRQDSMQGTPRRSRGSGECPEASVFVSEGCHARQKLRNPRGRAVRALSAGLRALYYRSRPGTSSSKHLPLKARRSWRTFRLKNLDSSPGLAGSSRMLAAFEKSLL